MSAEQFHIALFVVLQVQRRQSVMPLLQLQICCNYNHIFTYKCMIIHEGGNHYEKLTKDRSRCMGMGK